MQTPVGADGCDSTGPSLSIHLVPDPPMFSRVMSWDLMLHITWSSGLGCLCQENFNASLLARITELKALNETMNQWAESELS